MEATTSASVLLAGILLKVGLFGIFKIFVFLNSFIFIVVFLSSVGLTFVTIITCLSRERKVLTALRRVTHINFGLYGIRILSLFRFEGAGILGVRHGFVSSLIFSFVGLAYHSRGTRVLYFLRGFLLFSLFFCLMVVMGYLSNAGTPPLLSF